MSSLGDDGGYGCGAFVGPLSDGCRVLERGFSYPDESEECVPSSPGGVGRLVGVANDYNGISFRVVGSSRRQILKAGLWREPHRGHIREEGKHGGSLLGTGIP